MMISLRSLEMFYMSRETYGNKVVVLQRLLLRSSTGEERYHRQDEARNREDQGNHYGQRPNTTVSHNWHLRSSRGLKL